MRTFVSLLLFVFSMPGFAGELVLKLASTPPLPGVVSTRSSEDLALRVLSGHAVAFARTSGRDYQQQARGGILWTQVQEVPLDAESVTLTPTLEEDGSVTVSLDLARKQGTKTQRYTTTLKAQPGEWVQLFGPAESQPRGKTVYGTRSVSDDSLYLRIDH
ncbi:hypothetical protein [Pseudohalioglobus lutimaris]|uniref:Uncharacterized protein n=1 Tax=Pseudohalioglobus lutimaris TaxID=1737061 RepID=A0A2N5X7X0_9GAMM|nr:hypothetical protein [Pseudohalioglobus lutimaris]PLW70584.1 hypothetical protein C0039_00165 [Pseudohalioglobus lutimaris]